MRRTKTVGMPLQQRSARYEQIECQCIWIIMVMMTSIDGWKLKSKHPRLSKKPWTIFNRCSPNSSLIGIIMIPGVIIMRKNIIVMNN